MGAVGLRLLLVEAGPAVVPGPGEEAVSAGLAGEVSVEEEAGGVGNL